MLSVLGALLCLLHFLVDVIGTGMVIPLATCDLQLDALKKGIILSAPFVGFILSTQIWGLLADANGRKWAVFWSQSVALVFSVLAALTPNYWVMVVFRFFVGLV